MPGPVLSPEELAQLDVSGARVRRLLQSPQEQAERIYNEAYRAASAAGHDAGVGNFVAATMEAVQAVRSDFFALEPMLAPLVMKAVEKIIGALPPETVAQRAIATAMSESATGLAVTLRVAPDDLDTMRGAVQSLLAEKPELATGLAAVEADASLRKGEMLLETLKGRTHFGIDYQLARLRYAMEAAT